VSFKKAAPGVAPVEVNTTGCSKEIQLPPPFFSLPLKRTVLEATVDEICRK
jgi:hypothetical protein